MRILLVIFCIAFSLTVFAQEKEAECEKPLFAFNYQKENILLQKKKDEDSRRGCCSHHGGVCGCSGGRALCCDGTLSPTCGCD